MNENIKKIAPLIKEQIDHSNHILLHCHPNPDADSVCSALAMMHALEGMGKKVTVIQGDSRFPPAFQGLPGIEKVEMKNYLELDLSPFDLFIILDSSSKDRISRQGEVNFGTMKTIVIDHHDTQNINANLQLVEPQLPATANILYLLFVEWGIEITVNMALCLFIGLYDDTGGFKYPGTTAQTLEVASKLAHINPNYHTALFNLENMIEPNQVKFITVVYNSIKNYFSGKLALAEVRYSDLQQYGLSRRDSSGLEMSNKLRTVIGWDIDITCIEYEPNVVGLSMRTRNPDKYDLTKIAGPLGGGGHKASSGAELRLSFDEVKKRLLTTIQTAYPDLGSP